MRKPRKVERLQYGVSVIVDGSVYKNAKSQARARVRALKHFFDTDGRGKTKGVKLIGRWRNPDNKLPQHANWKTTEMPGQSLEDFYGTLYGARGALRELHQKVEQQWREYARPNKTKGSRKKTNTKTSRTNDKKRSRSSGRVARKTRSTKQNANRKSRNSGQTRKRK